MTSDPPIFILGVPRSGTTLLSVMFDGHSRVAIPYESHFFPKYHRERDAIRGGLASGEGRRALVERILAEPYVKRWDHQVRPDEVDLARCDSVESTIEQIYTAYARHFGKDVWGDKTPRYVTEAHVLNAMFPGSRFIHIVRDGRDVALSLVRMWWGPNNFPAALQRWAEQAVMARRMLAMLPPERSVEVRFEDLVADPEAHLRRITAFLGLGFEPGMLDYSARAGEKVGARIDAHHEHLAKRPTTDQAYKWRERLGPADQAIAHQVAGAALAEFGYPEGVRSHPMKRLRRACHRAREAYATAFPRKRTDPRSRA